MKAFSNILYSLQLLYQKGTITMAHNTFFTSNHVRNLSHKKRDAKWETDTEAERKELVALEGLQT